MEAYSLLKVNDYIKQVIALNFEDSIWIDAEISQVKEVRGQVYLEFVQKSENDNTVIAKAQGVIWFKSVLFIKKKLGEIFDSILQEGIQIRFKAKIEFHEVFGLKFSLEDIEPSFTLGQLEINRQKTISRLHTENLLYKNKETSLPPAIKNIAIISSEKAAGLQDFITHLDDNPFAYRFRTILFDSSMQGANVERDILHNLIKIKDNVYSYDCVAIIRGGGSKMDLSFFDNYDISAAVANFPIPVFTGIGHDIDKNVIELVAHSPLKTPTAVADFIIQYNLEFENGVSLMFDKIKNLSQQTTNTNSTEINLIQNRIFNNAILNISSSRHKIEILRTELKNNFSKIVTKENSLLSEKTGTFNYLDPVNLLERGYSYTSIDGKTIRSVEDVKINDLIKTHLKDGCFESKVI
ncbi:MAG: exodeoxyribonuclease VII large subunit [Saprospiraceae bacterium]|nr:exodeoxyribonuclease VII large subunit [Saprospiraceae bacterium]